MLKRPRLDLPLLFLSIYIGTSIPRGRPFYYHTVNDAYRIQVLSELSRAKPVPGSHGEETNRLVLELLTKVEHPEIDSSSGNAVEAWFSTGDEAVRLVFDDQMGRERPAD